MSRTIEGFEARFNGPCQVCERTAPGDYVKYNVLGFELLYLVCGVCFLNIHVAGLSRLKAEVHAFREQLDKGGDGDSKTDDRDAANSG